jgi:hypothetical protein
MVQIAMQQNDESGSTVTWGEHVSESSTAPRRGIDDEKPACRLQPNSRRAGSTRGRISAASHPPPINPTLESQ